MRSKNLLATLLSALIPTLIISGISSFSAYSASSADQINVDEVKVSQGLKYQKVLAHQKRRQVLNQYIVELNSKPIIQIKRESAPALNGIATTQSKSSVMSSSAMQAAIAQAETSQKLMRNDIKFEMIKRAKDTKILAEYDYLLNGVAVQTSLSLEQLRALPNVKAAHPVEMFQAKLDRALPIIKAMESWEKIGGQSMAGKGMRIAVIDSGISPDNPMFNDEGMTAPATRPDDDYCATTPSFCNNKLIVARMYPPSDIDYNETGEFESPKALSGHGSHVAGIATGREAITDTGETVVGVAPGAYLMAYKALWTQEGTGSSVGLFQALEDAAQDGADVINNSWGSGPGGLPSNSTYQSLFKQLEDSGIVIVSAAGNEGALGAGSIGCPGCIESGIAVASTTTDLISGYLLEFDGNEILSNPGDNFVEGTSFSGMGVMPTDEDQVGCEAWAEGAVQGKVAVVNRGECFFSEKAGFAAEGGAIALVVINNVDGPLIRMVMGDGVTLPATFISKSNGARVKDFLENSLLDVISMTGDRTSSNDPEVADVVSNFSSLGPNGDDGYIKPDMSAPGDLILSATSPDDETTPELNYAYIGGTSMATPMVSGAAALLKQYYLDERQITLTAHQIKSILINSVDVGVKDSTDTRLATAFETGSGRLNVVQAMELNAYAKTPNNADNNCFVFCEMTNTLVSLNDEAQTWSGELVLFNEKLSGSVSPNQVQLSSTAPEVSYNVNVELPLDMAPGWYFGQLVWTNTAGDKLTQAVAVKNSANNSDLISLDQVSASDMVESYKMTTTNFTSEDSFVTKINAVDGAEIDVNSVTITPISSVSDLTVSNRQISFTSDIEPTQFILSTEKPFDNVDLSTEAGANKIVCSANCDEFTAEIPFNYTYLGSVQDKITISENGIVVIGDTISAGTNLASNEELPSSASPNAVFAAFWTDFDLLDPNDSEDEGGGDLYYHEYSINDKDYLIVQWNKVKLWTDLDRGFTPDYLGVSSKDVEFTFQVIVEKDSDNIWINYLDIPEQPNFYTVGLESTDGSIGYTQWIDGEGAKAATTNDTLSFTYSESETLTVDFSVNNVDADSEFAVNDNKAIDEDETLIIDVLANDRLGDRAAVVARVAKEGRIQNAFESESAFTIDSASLVISTEPTTGTATIEDGKVTYVPLANYFGTDSFEYTVTNSNDATSTATVTIQIAAVNDAPVINSVAIPSEITEGQTVTISADATDVDSNLTYTWELPKGMTSGNLIGESVSVTFGTYTTSTGVITLTVTDGIESTVSNTTVTFKKKPVATTPTTPTKKSGGGSTTPMLLTLIGLLIFIKRAQILSKALKSN